MPLRLACLFQGAAVVGVVDLILVWRMPQILRWHSAAITSLLALADVPWQAGKQLAVLPGASAALLRTRYLDYDSHPLYPGLFVLTAFLLYGISYRRLSAPLKPLLFLPPASLGITFLYLQTANGLPYSPEDFSAIWYRGEVYLWLLLPAIFALSFFILNVPLVLKMGWLCALLVYSFLWSAVRLATALATFHYFGSIWMPFFYFTFGTLADFLYIVAVYSLAMDGAAKYLATQKEAWR